MTDRRWTFFGSPLLFEFSFRLAALQSNKRATGGDLARV
jgi:hypothetical protein